MSPNLRLANTESLVHLPGVLPRGYVGFKIFVPDETIEVLDTSSLSDGWQGDLPSLKLLEING